MQNLGTDPHGGWSSGHSRRRATPSKPGTAGSHRFAPVGFASLHVADGCPLISRWNLTFCCHIASEEMATGKLPRWVHCSLEADPTSAWWQGAKR